jgi:YfiH family protein
MPKNMLYRQPALFAAFPQLIAAESTRHGGLSPAPYHSLNLGINTDDAPAQVEENRHRFFQAIGAGALPLASSYQVHGKAVLIAEQAGRYEGYDALVTDQRGLLIGVTVADCAPILVYDAQNRAVAAIHAGWKGTAAHIVRETLLVMAQRFGTRGADCWAFIGTCIDGANYEVDETVAGHFDGACKWPGRQPGKWQLDLKAANKMQLLAFGIPEAQMEISPFSTFIHGEDYFSHRREDGRTGRMLAVIGMTDGE